ncbi:carbohydrate ABC transporter permease [Roseburia sp. 1XD42-69]|uniref:carbohydrate ABC transporter permease n=1 Tax=Roseburia sp. 1XD42-69 TaxID=2320088 RepID=UPI000EA0B956|nr:carbohydrate ABC transporter permease [Roseburia sp. 1XD42-69]MCX4320592.1 carbohydrate ABC transporter permease [Lachnospiraceae bacterium]RKJ62259.1 carbohydrate ABC transporter permease [Roseburia sp. 1XD42-69]
MREIRTSGQIKSREKILDYILVVIFIGILIITLYPFLNVLAISLNDPMDTMRNINFILPRKFTMNNYIYVFQENNLIVPFMMSVARTLIGTLVSVFSTAMIAYVMSRRDFYFNKIVSFLFIITMYVSGGMIPEYLLLTRNLKMGNSFLVYLLPGLIWAYNIVLMRSFIDGLPDALQEAARLDGANDFTIWYKIIVPLCKPVLATVGLFYAVGQWNAFMDTYLYARDLPTLQYVLYEIMQQAEIKVDPHAVDQVKNAVSPLSVRMAITMIATVPIIVVYPFLQKYFVGGMTVGAVKD